MTKIFVIILIILAFSFLLLRSKPLVLGMAEKSFVSPNRPSFSFTPIQNMQVSLAAKANIKVDVVDSLTEIQYLMSYYTYYTSKNSHLLCMLVINNDDQYAWLADNDTLFEEYYKTKINIQNKNIEQTSFILNRNDDPFADLYSDNAMYVRRFTFFDFVRQAKIIIEYREPYKKDVNDLELFKNPVANNEFEKAALSSFSMQFDKNELPKVIDKFNFDENMQRQNALTKYIGKLIGVKR